MVVKLCRYIFLSVLIASGSLFQFSSAKAWVAESGVTDFGDKQYTLSTYFKAGSGPVSNKMPPGAFKAMAAACTGGYFEIGFFDMAANPELLDMGSPTTMRVRFNGSTSTSTIKVNTDKGSTFVQVNDPKSLAKKLNTSTTFAVEFRTDIGFYRATFDVKGFKGYSSKFKSMGCKI